ncbi:MAG: VOC family protein, partial [Porticoccaceae bacterium]|nr:VOC family protein [Porticoccaceae bacterium]
MDPQFDHAVIFVSDLEKAIADFADLGFDVVRGGSHGSTE